MMWSLLISVAGGTDTAQGQWVTSV